MGLGAAPKKNQGEKRDESKRYKWRERAAHTKLAWLRTISVSLLLSMRVAPSPPPPTLTITRFRGRASILPQHEL